MQVVKFLVVLAVTVLFILLFNWHNPFGSPVPAVGAFFSPNEGFWQNARMRDMPDQQDFELAGAEDSIRVIFDERLVPHIFAQNIQDAAFAQGYVHAMHRLWQMDISVRQISGRLSEVLGERTLESDRINRRKGMVLAAQNALIALERRPSEMAVVQAYADGVNAYLKTLDPRDYPIEFKLLNYAPEEWTPLKTTLFLQNMVNMLASRNSDLQRTNARSIFGDELFAFLYPEKNPRQSPIIPPGTPWNFEPVAVKKDTADLPDMLSEVIRRDGTYRIQCGG